MLLTRLACPRAVHTVARSTAIAGPAAASSPSAALSRPPSFGARSFHVSLPCRKIDVHQYDLYRNNEYIRTYVRLFKKEHVMVYHARHPTPGRVAGMRKLGKTMGVSVHFIHNKLLSAAIGGEFGALAGSTTYCVSAKVPTTLREFIAKARLNEANGFYQLALCTDRHVLTGPQIANFLRLKPTDNLGANYIAYQFQETTQMFQSFGQALYRIMALKRGEEEEASSSPDAAACAQAEKKDG